METMQEIIATHDKKYRYMLLDRMRTDCAYYLGNGNRQVKTFMGWKCRRTD